jgi:hypothetical protein
VDTYMGNGTGLDPERLFAIPYASHYQAEGLALGDTNSDGCSDVAIADLRGVDASASAVFAASSCGALRQVHRPHGGLLRSSAAHRVIR